MPRKGENITKRKDGRWEARILKGYDLNGKAKYQFLYGKTYSEVRQKKDSYIRQGSSECGKSNSQKVLFCEIAADYLAHIHNEIKESSFCRYRAIVQSHLLPFFGSRKIGEIRLQRSYYKPQSFPAVPRTRPIECLKRDISNFYERSSIELIFMILFELMGISYYDVFENREYAPLQYRALSPCFRCEAIRNEQYSRECRMMGKYGLHTEDDVKQFAADREQELSRLSAERQKIDNARRRMTDPQEKQKNSEARHAITQKMIIVRREKNLADDIYWITPSPQGLSALK